MTDQEVFDTVVKHLRAQQAKAYSAYCRYRLVKDGVVLKCAVGCLIPDDKYNDIMEGRHASNPLVMAALPQGINMDLVNELQYVHDGEGVSKWETRFKGLAEKYHLNLEET